MTHARVVQSGNCQAVLLPKEFRLVSGQVEILRQGSDIVLRERPASAVVIFDALASMAVAFITDARGDSPLQERETF